MPRPPSIFLDPPLMSEYRLKLYSIMITLDKWVLITVSNSKCWCMPSYCWEREIPSWLPEKFGILKLLLTVFLGRDLMTQTREGVALACTYDQAYFTCVKSNSHFQKETSPRRCKDLSKHQEETLPNDLQPPSHRYWMEHVAGNLVCWSGCQ